MWLELEDRLVENIQPEAEKKCTENMCVIGIEEEKEKMGHN